MKEVEFFIDESATIRDKYQASVPEDLESEQEVIEYLKNHKREWSFVEEIDQPREDVTPLMHSISLIDAEKKVFTYAVGEYKGDARTWTEETVASTSETVARRKLKSALHKTDDHIAFITLIHEEPASNYEE